MKRVFELKDRNVIEMKTGELLLYVEDNGTNETFIGLNNDAFIIDSYIVIENIKRVYSDYTMNDVIYINE